MAKDLPKQVLKHNTVELSSKFSTQHRLQRFCSRQVYKGDSAAPSAESVAIWKNYTSTEANFKECW